MARRRSPKPILSDNAAYFVAARKQIKKQPLNINKDEIATKFQLKSIDWRLNPPSALHFSGVWERLVSIIKRFFLNRESDRLSRDLFSIFVVECEGLINSRPMQVAILIIPYHLHLTTSYLGGHSFTLPQLHSTAKQIPIN